MKESLYTRFTKNRLILRDELAIDRTLLANERTLLSYLRGAVTLLIAGVTIVHFAERPWFFAVGVACIPLGLLGGAIGIFRFWSMHHAIAVIRKATDHEETPEED